MANNQGHKDLNLARIQSDERLQHCALEPYGSASLDWAARHDDGNDERCKKIRACDYSSCPVTRSHKMGSPWTARKRKRIDGNIVAPEAIEEMRRSRPAEGSTAPKRGSSSTLKQGSSSSLKQGSSTPKGCSPPASSLSSSGTPLGAWENISLCVEEREESEEQAGAGESAQQSEEIQASQITPTQNLKTSRMPPPLPPRRSLSRRCKSEVIGTPVPQEGCRIKGERKRKLSALGYGSAEKGARDNPIAVVSSQPSSPYTSPARSNRRRCSAASSQVARRSAIDPALLQEEHYPHFPLCTPVLELRRLLDEEPIYRQLDTVLWPEDAVMLRFQLGRSSLLSGSSVFATEMHLAGPCGFFSMMDLLLAVSNFYSSPFSKTESSRIQRIVWVTYAAHGEHLGTGMGFGSFFDAFFTYGIAEPLYGSYEKLEKGSLRPCDLFPGWLFEGFVIDPEDKELIVLITEPLFYI